MTKIGAETAVTRTRRRATPHDAEPANHACYEEYARSFDEIPILDDVVRTPRRPPVPRSFVRGERRSLRKEERPDAHAVRESQLAELERHYQEYVAPAPVPTRDKPSRRPQKKRSTRARKRK